MVDAWGLPQPGRNLAGASPRRRRTGKGRLSPQTARATHRGIVWLHLCAIAVWLLVGAILGLITATGRDVPVMVIVAGLGAAAGHALFLVIHFLLAFWAQRRDTPGFAQGPEAAASAAAASYGVPWDAGPGSPDWCPPVSQK